MVICNIIQQFSGRFLMFVLISPSITNFTKSLNWFLYMHRLQEVLNVKTLSLIFKPNKPKRAGSKDSNISSFPENWVIC